MGKTYRKGSPKKKDHRRGKLSKEQRSEMASMRTPRRKKRDIL